MNARNIKNGYLTSISANIYYSISGKMVTVNDKPNQFYTITNNKGEVKVYDPVKNEVYTSQNIALSTESTQLYYFFNNKIADLGLSDLGFQVVDTQFDEGLIITIWMPPAQLAAQIGRVKLVHENGKPIFISYTDSNDDLLKKTYFYDYNDINGLLFPASITQMNYVNKSDSSITKITYSDIEYNTSRVEELLQFEIPADAKITQW